MSEQDKDTNPLLDFSEASAAEDQCRACAWIMALPPEAWHGLGSGLEFCPYHRGVMDGRAQVRDLLQWVLGDPENWDGVVELFARDHPDGRRGLTDLAKFLPGAER